MQMRTRIGLFILAAAVMATVTFVVPPGEGRLSAPGSPAPSTAKMAIGISSALVSTLPIIAEEKGFFAKAGIDVAVKFYSAGKKSLEAMEAGEVDICTTTEFIPALHGFRKPDLRILANIASGEETQVVGRKDRNIATPADIAGKRVGVTAGTISDYFLSSFIAFNALEGVAPVDLLPHQMAGALGAGSVDAVITWQPIAQTLKDQLAENAVSFPAQQGQSEFFLLLTRKSWVASHATEVEWLLQALLQAEGWTKAHPEEARQIVARRIGTTPSDLEKIWGLYRFAVNLPQSLLISMETEARWVVRKGLVPAQPLPDFARLLEVRPLVRVKPSAVGMFR